MIERLLRSRGWRKFRRNRVALVSCAVILIYACIALLVLASGFFGRGITLESVEERVTYDKYPGFFGSVNEERRVADLVERFKTVNRFIDMAQDAPDPMLTLRAQDWAERRFIDDFDEIRSIRDDVFESFEALQFAAEDIAAFEEELQYIDEDLETAEGEDREILLEDRAGVEADLDAAREVVDAAPSKIEQALFEMQPMPSGWAGFVYFLRTSLGSDDKGASVLFKSLYSTKIAFQIGVVTAVISVLLGTFLGASAGFFGGWVDVVVMWIVSTLSSVPYL
ncbi:MAG: hypothetical protein KDA28_10015, partial [Phycisphaerales bacterium]|nr:hypothetical protein [Phycisphaerales bacterium]